MVSFAFKELSEELPEDPDEERELIENKLIYSGFVCILDPPRPGVKNAVARLDAAGIFPIMITGDAYTTAGTIAEKVGVLDPDEMVVEGKDIPDDTLNENLVLIHGDQAPENTRREFFE